jgi:hypothetical protein
MVTAHLLAPADRAWWVHVQSKAGEAKLGQLCSEGGFQGGKLLASDPEFDPPDTPDVADFLKAEGLSAVPV